MCKQAIADKVTCQCCVCSLLADSFLSYFLGRVKSLQKVKFSSHGVLNALFWHLASVQSLVRIAHIHYLTGRMWRRMPSKVVRSKITLHSHRKQEPFLHKCKIGNMLMIEIIINLPSDGCSLIFWRHFVIRSHTTLIC